MKKVSLLILVSMILLLAFTSCDMLPESVAGPLTSVKDTVVGGFNTAKNTVLGWLGIETEPEHEHVWTDATCESPKTCECGETEGEALGHTWTEATCESPKTCSVCSKTEGNPLKHEWEAATCETPATCKLCGETSGEALDHTWIDATCTDAKYCAMCNKTEGTASGHDWMEATCVLPKTCKVCAATEGVANGHTWNPADCENPETCLNCGATEGECVGHNWTEATCVLPEICLNCGETQGEALGHDFADATCTEAKTCKNGCGITQGSPLGHDWTEATCVDPSVCNTCGAVSEVAPDGHDFADATCVLPKTCKLCQATEGEALGHKGGTATCNTLAVCEVCEESYGEYDGHNIVTTDATFTCSKCNVSFSVVSEGVYFNGDDMTGTTIGSYTGTAIGNYVGTGSAYNGGANKVVSENGVWKAITDEARVDGTDAAGTTQMQVWLPQIKTGFKEFNAGNKSIGAMSFKLKLDFTYAKDVFSLLLHNTNGWNPENGIRTNVLDIQPIVTEGVVTGYKANVWVDNSRTTVELPVKLVDGGSATEWFEVQLFFVMDSEKDVVTTYYYIDGAFLASGSYTNTVDGDALSCVYINLNAWNAGTGYYMDDILFGHTTNSHYVFDHQSHVVTPATCTEPETCSCGLTKGEALGHDWADATCTAPKSCKRDGCDATEGDPLGHSLELSYTEEAATLACACGVTLTLDEYREWDGEGTDSKFSHSPNGKVETVYANDGTWGFIFKPDTETTEAAGNGWAEYPGSGCFGAQIQPWIPSNNRADCLAGFSCENNAVGVISFDIKYNITRHENRDTNFQLGVGKPRNASDWNDGGSWTDDQITILCIDDYSEDGILVRGGVNSSMTLATIGVENGWSEWFNVTISIEMLDTGYMNTYYYINGVFCGSYSRDLSVADADGRFLNPKEIEAFQFSGWTYAANTGVMFDNMVFGYTAGAHNLLTGEAHDRLAATCTEPEQCTCGYVYGPALGHTSSEATCTEDAMCSRCGEVAEKALGHNLVVSGYDAAAKTMTYACANNCGASYALNGYYMDGTNTDNLVVVNNGADYVLNINEAGQYEMLYPHDTTGTDAIKGQQQIWVPVQGNPADMFDFSCANNAIGFLSFKVSGYNNYQNIQFKLNAERGAADWSWSTTSFAAFDITPVKSDDQTTVDLIGYNNTLLKTIEVGEDKWTPWLDVVIGIQLKDDNTMALTYIVDGELLGTIEAAMPISTGRITSVYINGRTSVKDSGFKFDDLVFAYTKADSHYKVDDVTHVAVSEATCTEPSLCACGYVLAPAKGHTAGDPTCTEDAACSVCGVVVAKATGHNLAVSGYDAAAKTMTYACANNCGASYALNGYYMDGTNTDNLVVVNNGADYVLNINEAGQYEMLYPHDTTGTDAIKGQQQIWVPVQGNPADMFDFSCANNAIGFLSFKVSGYNNYQNIQFKLNAERGAADWSWSTTSFAAFDITPVKSDDQTTVDLIGYNNTLLKTIEVGEDKWTPWLDVVIGIQLKDDNTMALTYIVDGELLGTIEAAMPISTGRITSVYINGRTSVKDSGFKFDDLVFGYVAPVATPAE